VNAETESVVIVTRHAGAVEWLRLRHGITGRVITHAEATDVADKIVIGVLPLHLAALAARVISIDLPGLRPDQRGKDLTPDEMDEAGATLEIYHVFNRTSKVADYLCGKTVVVTDKTGAVEWLRYYEFIDDSCRVISKAEIADIAGCVVIGMLPLHLATHAEAVVTIDLPGLRPDQRGKDLTLDEMDEAGATLSAYIVYTWPKGVF